MEQKELLDSLETMKSAIVEKVTSATAKTIEEKSAASEEKAVKAAEAIAAKTNEGIEKLSEKLDTTIDAVDKMQAKMKVTDFKPEAQKKSFGEAFSEQMAEIFESKADDFARFAKNRDAKISFELKAVGNMTVAGNLTGEGQATYNSKQGLVPANKINFRDLIPTTPSPTGIYVSYRETGSEGAIAVQTEGAAKGQIDYDLTRVSVVSDYVAGFARFSKQMMYQLPWLQNTLPRLLMRDFYKKENSTFYAAVAAAASGNATVTPTVDAEQVIAWIANQLNADFTPSFGLVNFTDWLWRS